jgi:hypothetical protein
MPARDSAAHLLHLLEEEGAALVDGDFPRLRAILPEKEGLCADPGAILSADPAMLSRISRLSARNETLIAAARGGLRAAVDRLGAVGRVDEGLRTYDRSGASLALSDAVAGPIRRA